MLETLKQSGFNLEKTPQHPLGIYVKRLPLGDMPYAREHLCGTLGHSEEDIAKIEYDPATSDVTFTVPLTGYAEEPVFALSDEGAGLLRDAGVLHRPDAQQHAVEARNDLSILSVAARSTDLLWATGRPIQPGVCLHRRGARPRATRLSPQRL